MLDAYTLADLRDWPAVAGAESPPIRLSVFGDPVAHSRSPQMHNPALRAAGIQAAYARLHILPAELKEAIQRLPPLGFIGANITIPHKAAVMGWMHEVDPLAQRAGGVNTVLVKGNHLAGFSTDGPGLSRAIQDEFGVPLRELRVMILGAAGGAGTAIAIQCEMEKVPRLVLVNRTFPRAQKLAQRLRGDVEVALWEEASLARVLPEVDLVINATPLGMSADPALACISPIPAALILPYHFIYDTVYTLGRTPLLMAAEEAGACSANGLSMLLRQGALSFEIWFGRPAPIDVMRNALLATAA